MRTLSSGRLDGRRGFTLIELLVVIAIIGVLIGLLLPAVQAAREASRRSSCSNNLKQLGLAINTFYDSKQRLPSGGRPTASSTIRQGIFIQLLPYIEQQALYDRYDSEVNWGHANNLVVTGTRIPTYECPSSPRHGGLLDHNPDGFTGGSAWVGIVANGDYAGSLGVAPGLDQIAAVKGLVVKSSAQWTSTADKTTNGFLPKNSSLTFGDITDGLSNTIAIFESAGRPLVYRRGALISPDPSAHHTNAGGWCRPASDVMFAGSSKDGTQIPGLYINRTNGYDHATEAYGTSGYPAPYGTEGSSQPFAFHNGGLNVLFGDGSVRFLDQDASIDVVAAQVTRNQGGVEGKLGTLPASSGATP